MLFQDKVDVTFGSMLDSVTLPEMYRVKQKFNNEHIANPAEETRRQMMRLFLGREETLRGKRIAITIGSRGIRHNTGIMRAVVASLRDFGAEPFLVPCMGSHGGATAAGQLEMIRHLGVDGETLGCPVIASMETRQIGELPDGTPLHFSKDALDADGIFVANKIKPHADFKGEHESGLVKMLVIGLGKHKGCSLLHTLGFAAFPRILPQAAAVILQRANVVGALAILENAYDDIMHLEGVRPEDLIRRDRELLVKAKQNIARIKAEQLDVLVIDEIGKNISGEGMDPNVTGRPGSYLNQGFDHIKIGSIVIRDVTEESSGNGAGIGMADITTIACVRKIDLGAMYTNSITASILGPSRLPMVLNNDLQALKIAIRVAAPRRMDSVRLAQIKNTLLLEEIHVSRSLMEEMRDRNDVEVLGRVPLDFDENGYIIGSVDSRPDGIPAT